MSRGKIMVFHLKSTEPSLHLFIWVERAVNCPRLDGSTEIGPEICDFGGGGGAEIRRKDGRRRPFSVPDETFITFSHSLRGGAADPLTLTWGRTKWYHLWVKHIFCGLTHLQNSQRNFTQPPHLVASPLFRRQPVVITRWRGEMKSA